MTTSKKKLEADLDEELRLHLEIQTEDNIEAGMPAMEARRAARLALGNLTSVKEQTRETFAFAWLEELWQDIRFGCRVFRRDPGSTIIAVICLALGIGATTAVYSVVHAAFVDPLPWKDPDRLVTLKVVRYASGGPHMESLRTAELMEVRDQVESLEHVSQFEIGKTTLGGRGEPVRLGRWEVIPGFLDMIGVRPALGRTFVEEEQEPGKHQVAILTHALWKERFGESPDVIGEHIDLSGSIHTVVGVLPTDFFLPWDYECDLLVPKMTSGAASIFKGGYVIGRLKSGVGLEELQVEMDAMEGRKNAQVTSAADKIDLFAFSFCARNLASLRKTSLMLLTAAAFVLLIACANVAGLMLAQSAQREREISLRVALGAGRQRLARQVLTESVMLSSVGGILGVLVALWGVQLLVPTLGRAASGVHRIGVNWPVLGSTVAATVLTGLAFGCLPALHGAKASPAERLKEGSRRTTLPRRRRRAQSSLVVAQVSLALVLVLGAGLLGRSLIYVIRVDPGLNPRNVLVVWTNLGYSYRDARRPAFYGDLLDRVRALPGVISAGYVDRLPFRHRHQSKPVPFTYAATGREAPIDGRASVRYVSPDYFRTMEIPFLEGRCFTEKDDVGSRSLAIVNEALASKYWPGEDRSVGKLLAVRTFGTDVFFEVAGVVGNVTPRGEETPTFYTLHQLFGGPMVIRTSGDPLDLAPTIGEQMLALDPGLPPWAWRVEAFEDVVSQSTSIEKGVAKAPIVFSLFALFLAAVGIYGMMARAAAQRSHEVGIRIAMGARRSGVVRMVLLQGFWVVAIGMGIGLVAAAGLSPLLARYIHGITTLDPWTYIGAAGFLLAVALLACYIPARRTSRVDPMEVLRSE